jgi:DNA polymerase III subunit beta
MKFSCNQQILSKALNTVSKAVTIRTTIPILKGILLKATTDGKLILAASDLDLSIEKNIDVNVEKEGSVVVLAKLFGDIIRKLPNEEIYFELQDNGNVMIKTSQSEFRIIGLAAEEFPNIGEVEDVTNQLAFNKDIFKEMIRKTAFCASIDESKGVIVGVLMELEERKVNMVALDGFRMAVTRENMINKEEGKVIIPAKILNEINKILSENEKEEEVNIIISNKKAVILLERTKIVIRLLEGEFIKYKEIIPKENPIKIIVSRNDMVEAIERASLLAKEGKNNLIKCKVEENLFTITSRSDEGTVKEEIIVEKEGENIEIGFNSKYLIEALRAIDDDKVVLEFKTGTTPCLLKPISGQQYEYLILPVRISSN